MQSIIRKATMADIGAIVQIYDRVHDATEKGEAHTGWIRGIYPVRATAGEALGRGDLFVQEMAGSIVGAGIINQAQLEIYKKAPWQYAAPDDKVMVLHTLVIDPTVKGAGLGRAFMDFYARYASEHGCPCLRMDTNEKNIEARKFYKKMNFAEIAVLPCQFNNLGSVNLVLLEKKLPVRA